MVAFKCKMCGGDLNITPDTTVCVCEFCDTQQTVPTVDNQKKANLFNRANRLRMSSDFDAAAMVYHSIVAEFPDEAEAYWGLCLCKYGIEYVDDTLTGHKIPTCHRTHFESIHDDQNYKQACDLADWTVPGSTDTKIRTCRRISKDYAALLLISTGVRPSFKLIRS